MEAESAVVTDRRQIVAVYNRLVQIQPSPVVELNSAVAIATRDGPEVGLALIDAVLARDELANYCLAYICLGYIQSGKFENTSENERNTMLYEYSTYFAMIIFLRCHLIIQNNLNQQF